MEGRDPATSDTAGTAPELIPAAEDAVHAESDAVVVRKVVDGSQAALAELYDRHAAAVFRASLRLLGERQQAEEVVQETFLTLWNRAEQFNPAMGSLRAWLMTIGRNRTIDRLRAAGRQPSVVHFGAIQADADGHDRQSSRLERQILVADDASDPERQAEVETLRLGVRRALEGLPANERQALVLAYFEGLSQQEIAVRLEWPLGTVKTRTRRALRRLRDVVAPLVEPFADHSFTGIPDGSR